MEERNIVIEFRDSIAYNCKSTEEAIEMFKREHGVTAEIVNIIG